VFLSPRESRFMRPELLFVVGVDQIKLPDLTSNGERFQDKYFLANDSTIVRILLEPVKQYIGSVEYGWLVRNCPAVAYRKEFITNDAFIKVKNDFDRSLRKEMQAVLALFTRCGL
jgi:hypothetical protein